MKRNHFILLLLLALPSTGSATLLLIKNFHGIQQTTDYTCGPASVVGLFKYFGFQTTELTAAKEMKTDPNNGTKPEDIVNWLKSKGLKVTWGENGSIELLKNNLKKDIPTLIEWIDWGGHWTVVVGLDDKGTATTEDDEIILADPYDKVDGKADGLTYFNLERFDSMWFDALYFGKLMKKIYIFVNR